MPAALLAPWVTSMILSLRAMLFLRRVWHPGPWVAGRACDHPIMREIGTASEAAWLIQNLTTRAPSGSAVISRYWSDWIVDVHDAGGRRVLLLAFCELMRVARAA